MKYINKKELSEKMGYSTYNSFMNSKANKELLINLVEYIENKVIEDYENRILLILKEHDSKLSLLKKEFREELVLLLNKYK